ncbi:POC1 centriolar protein A [Ceratobasidium sp. 370]|nr:POC1 centriolar protein A [Ceratobasidium sp. 370]
MRGFSVVGDVATHLLKLLVESSIPLDPLRDAARIALQISRTAQKFRSNKDDWREFGDYVRAVTASVAEALARGDSQGDPQDNLKDQMVALKKTLDKANEKIMELRTLRWYKRCFTFMKDPEMIAEMKEQIDNATKSTLTGVALRTYGNTMKICEELAILCQISKGVADVVAKTLVSDLPQAFGASWDPNKACHAGTRVKLIEEIFAWIDSSNESIALNTPGISSSGGAQVFVLTGVVGVGKSTVAHSVAKRCNDEGRLGSSFFFDRSIERRKNLDFLFTTVAAGLANLDPRLAEEISNTIRHKMVHAPSVSATQQFDELVVASCQVCPLNKRVVLVLDGLDEVLKGDLEVLEKILCEGVHKLPNTFRILVTSRMSRARLANKGHIRHHEMEIDSLENLDDMKILVSHRLQEIAKDRGFDEDWPGEELRADFIAKAGGLALWTNVASRYLEEQSEPEKDLKELLSKTTNYPVNEAQKKMDELYTNILQSYHASDKNFLILYGRVMGTTIAAKTPLTMSGMAQLFDPIKLASNHYILGTLTPLLTGMQREEHNTTRVRVLHDSLRDFLVNRACDKPVSAPFRIVEKERSAHLAVLCLGILNRGLVSLQFFESAATRHEDGAPQAMWYACRDWRHHLLDAGPSPEVELALVEFMDTKLKTWALIMSDFGRSACLDEVWRWIRDHNLRRPELLRAEEEWGGELGRYALNHDVLSHEAEAQEAFQNVAGLIREDLIPQVNSIRLAGRKLQGALYNRADRVIPEPCD